MWVFILEIIPLMRGYCGEFLTYNLNGYSFYWQKNMTNCR